MSRPACHALPGIGFESKSVSTGEPSATHQPAESTPCRSSNGSEEFGFESKSVPAVPFTARLRTGRSKTTRTARTVSTVLQSPPGNWLRIEIWPRRSVRRSSTLTGRGAVHRREPHRAHHQRRRPFRPHTRRPRRHPRTLQLRQLHLPLATAQPRKTPLPQLLWPITCSSPAETWPASDSSRPTAENGTAMADKVVAAHVPQKVL